MRRRVFDRLALCYGTEESRLAVERATGWVRLWLTIQVFGLAAGFTGLVFYLAYLEMPVVLGAAVCVLGAIISAGGSDWLNGFAQKLINRRKVLTVGRVIDTDVGTDDNVVHLADRRR